ncbi:hypothetical protein SVAN01_03021 [Stagonosporopsis vannaccii]|nr:hypothetical protein SVAN01_03021 [Stagonosporopsis vannaccii]
MTDGKRLFIYSSGRQKRGEDPMVREARALDSARGDVTRQARHEVHEPQLLQTRPETTELGSHAVRKCLMQGTIPMPIRVISSMMNHEFQPAGVSGAWRGCSTSSLCSSPAAKLELHNALDNTNNAANKATRAIADHIHMQPYAYPPGLQPITIPASLGMGDFAALQLAFGGSALPACKRISKHKALGPSSIELGPSKAWIEIEDEHNYCAAHLNTYHDPTGPVI